MWWVLMCDAGMRLGEVRSITWSEIGETSIRIRGKGRRCRSVPTTRRILRIKAAVMKRYRLDPAQPVCGLSPRAVLARFDNGLKRAGMKKLSLCCHSLRHTFATRLLVAGVDIHRVGVLLGHASTMTTVGYLHTNEESLREAARRLDSLNGEPARGGSHADAETEAEESGGGEGCPLSLGQRYDEILELLHSGQSGGEGIEAAPLPRRPSPLDSLEDLV